MPARGLRRKPGSYPTADGREGQCRLPRQSRPRGSQTEVEAGCWEPPLPQPNLARRSRGRGTTSRTGRVAKVPSASMRRPPDPRGCARDRRFVPQPSSGQQGARPGCRCSPRAPRRCPRPTRRARVAPARGRTGLGHKRLGATGISNAMDSKNGVCHRSDQHSDCEPIECSGSLRL